MSITASVPVRDSGPADRRWILSPGADLLLIANLAWPLVAVAGTLAWTNEPVGFVQLYIISSAHRLITLPLVFLDRKWFPAQAGRFAAVGGLCTLLTLAGLALAWRYPNPADPTNLLAYLLALDYAWNAWHFASQHAGIFRIYGRSIEKTPDLVAAEREKFAIRIMALWVILRYVIEISVGKGMLPVELRALHWLDPLAFVPVSLLLASELRGYTPERLGRVSYLGSVVALYATIAFCMNFTSVTVLAGVLTAQAFFHAVEYITVCGAVARKKKGGAWDVLVPRLAANIVAFCLVCGIAMWSLLNLWSAFAWGLFTLWASYLHYAYDGMIWKSPKPARS